MNNDIIMFVEDPGAANYVAHLPAALAAQGITSQLFSAPPATEYLHQRGIPSQQLLTPHPSTLNPFPTPNTQRPTPLLVGTSENPDSYGLQMIADWRQAGGCSVGVVDAFANAAHRFRGRTNNPLAYVPDWLIVSDDWTRQAFVELGYAGSRIVVCGHPHYDAVRSEGRRLEAIGRETLRRKWLPNALPEQKVIVFVAEISTGLNSAQFLRSKQYTLHGTSGSNARTDIVIEEFLEAVALLSPRPYLVLRLHPKNTLREFAAYTSHLDFVSSGGVPLELIFAADIVVGMSSMLLLEAALLHRPTLSILPRACEQEWLPTTRTGLTPCATNRAALQHLLPQILLQTTPPNTDINSVLPTGSTERVTAFLAGLLSRS